jgi:serine/threonine protein kinase
MSSYLSDLDHHKINAQVNPWQVVETHYISDPSNGHRKVPRVKLWKVERVLGKGGCAEVRLETNREDDEKRAVKRMWTSGSTLKKEYQRELMALLEFSKPKYKEATMFVKFLGWFEDHECAYFAMEYIPLGDLEHNVPARARAISEGEIRDITCQVLEGLRIMHLEGFVHRDLKPKVALSLSFFDQLC